MNPISKLTPPELLAMHADITEELRRRGIVRSSNNPTADVAELLFCRAFEWRQAGNSNRAADATCAEGKLYQIKARRMTAPKTSRELGALRNLPAGGFHFLAAVLFESNYTVRRAAIIPHGLVLKHSAYDKHTNAWKFHLRDVAWEWPEVRDVTDELRAVAL